MRKVIMKVMKVIRKMGLFFMCLWCALSTIYVIKEINLINAIWMILSYINLGIYAFLNWEYYIYKRNHYLTYLAIFNLLITVKEERYRKQLSGDFEKVEALTEDCRLISDDLLMMEDRILNYKILEDTKFDDSFKEMQKQHMQIRKSID